MATGANGFQSSAYAAGSDKLGPGAGIGPDVEVAVESAGSGFFTTDYKKHEDLKTMLDSSKDGPKLDAMKRIISMVARGRDCSDLFPAVVKNVVSKNAEVKKLVYVYLTRYAEEQQDLALLSISTFQRALKDPNQLIRGSALRVLSSIRVPMIVPIMMLAIKEAVMDMSPYVRKTAAHAIPKLYSLDAEQKEQLMEVIEKLLGDRTTLVAGSAIQAFEEVCPERLDLIHKHYRKLCALLVDVEEWGQVVIINMLTRYARTQFVDPNREGGVGGSGGVDTSDDRKFYSDEEEKEEGEDGSAPAAPAKKAGNGNAEEDEEEEESNSGDDDEEEEEEGKNKSTTVKTSKVAGSTAAVYVMDSDHRLLLRTCRPLLNSRNSAVVMAVSQLYYHCSPRSEIGIVAKSLIRLLRCNKEVQYVVLSNIASMTIGQRSLFEPYLKSFYVHASDTTQVRLLKLEILTNLATETSISTILREFQSYVTSSDQEFVAATIQSIGRCACNIAEIADTCLAGLVQLMSKRDESVVAESVVVIRKLLQMQSSDHKEIIVHMARLVDTITVPMARASIIWLIGEYCDRIPRIAPDVLRKLAKTFVQEEAIVKLQLLNLAAKLCITNPKQTRLLAQYVLNLAKYDSNYDIRDRSRFLRALIFPHQSLQSGTGSDLIMNPSTASSPSPPVQDAAAPTVNYLARHAKKIFLATKPAPLLQSKFKDRPQYQLGSLSHLLNQRTTGYHDLPSWPQQAPDPSVRNVPEAPSPTTVAGGSGMGSRGGLLGDQRGVAGESDARGGRAFYSDEEGGEEEEEDAEEEEESSDEEESSAEEEDEDNGTKAATRQKSADSESSASDDQVSAKKSATKKPAAQEVSAAARSQARRVLQSTTEEESSSEEEDSEEEEEEESSEEEVVQKPPARKPQQRPPPAQVKSEVSVPTSGGGKKSRGKRDQVLSPPKQEYDLLLDFDGPELTNPPSSNSGHTSMGVGSILTPLKPSGGGVPTDLLGSDDTQQQPVHIPSQFALANYELVGKFAGVLGVVCRFPRSISVFNPRLVSVELLFTNQGNTNQPIRAIRVADAAKVTAVGMEMQAFPEIDLLGPKATTTALLCIDFRDTTQAASFTLSYQLRRASDLPLPGPAGGLDEESLLWSTERLEISVRAPVGELLQPVTMTDREFVLEQGKLRGMNEATMRVQLRPNTSPPTPAAVSTCVYTAANITAVSVIRPPGSNDSLLLRFAGRTVSGQLPCLIEVALQTSAPDCRVRVNSEKLTVASLLAKELADRLAVS